MTLKAFALNCTLKRSPASSSTDKLLAELADAFLDKGVVMEIVRALDYEIAPGVTSDEGEGDQWPELRRRILDADIFVIGSPIWLGQPSSVAKRVLERLDAFLSETDDGGRMPAYNKVAAAAVVGNEDGAHHVSAELFQALNDVGFTLAPGAVTYWVGEAMGKVDYDQLPATPEKTGQTTKALAAAAAHLATLLKQNRYPPVA